MFILSQKTALETKDFFCNGTDCNTTSKDGKGPNLIEELITPLCEQNKAKLLALNEVLEQAQQMIAEKEAELIVAGSSITCGCSGLDDILTFDRDCKNVILALEKLKKSIATKAILHKFEASITAIGQIKIGDVCIDKVYIHAQESPTFEVLLPSKKKTTMGVEFDISNATNKFKIDIQDTEAKDVKIDAVWKYLGNKVQEHQATFPITGAQLHEIFSSTPQERCDEVASIINKYSDKFEINTPLRMAHFLGQIGTETVGLKKLQESTCYSSKDRIKEVFGKIKYCDLFEGYESDLTECDSDETPKACNPALKKITSDLVVKDKYVCSSNLFDYTYSCRMGNGPASTKDGSTFLGKGFIHLTGKGQCPAPA